jgi:lysozyme
MSELLDLLKKHEGSKKNAEGRHILYRDSSAHLGFEGKPGKLTCGYGRNVDDQGFSDDEVELMLANDLKRVQAELDAALPWWRNLDWVRKMVLVDLGFNLGVTTGNPPQLLTFAKTLHLIELGNYAEAADHLLTTPWAKQVGGRAVELTTMLRTGEYHEG